MGGTKEKNTRTDHHHFLTGTNIFPEIQEVHTLGDIADCTVQILSVLRGQRGTRGLLPFSCSAASLKSGNFNPTMLWLRISLCSYIHKRTKTKHLYFILF